MTARRAALVAVGSFAAGFAVTAATLRTVERLVAAARRGVDELADVWPEGWGL